VITFVAWGGVGKTSLVAHWLARMAADGWRGAERVFDWSFYSQGTREQSSASSDQFIAKALEFFGDPELAGGNASPWDKGERLARLVAERPSILVLDGLEPLQHPPGPLDGKLKDPAVESLLRGLAWNNPGLCLVTTRVPLADLAEFQSTAREHRLEHLDEGAGALLLYASGVNRDGARLIAEADAADDPELRAASRGVGGHALSLRLLGEYLRLAGNGDVSRRSSVKLDAADPEFKTNPADADKPHGHAFKVMAAYESWLASGGESGAQQLAVLRMLGLFDRPADTGSLGALRREPVIRGLTGPVFSRRKGLSGFFGSREPIGERPWSIVLSRLEASGLVSLQKGPSGEPHSVDAHPLVRAYFGKRLREASPAAWRKAHRRLFEHLKNTTPYWPDTLEGLQPLYQAVAHGCLAGLYAAADHILRSRIQRGEDFAYKKLGAGGANLGAVACFFEQPWTRLVPGLSEVARARLFSDAGRHLRGQGRLTAAQEPMRLAIEADLRRNNWVNAVIDTCNLSELALKLGDIAGAVRYAEQSLPLLDNADVRPQRLFDAFGWLFSEGVWGERVMNLTVLADALHQAGRRSEALERFREAETLQARSQPDYPLLYSLPGFRFCDLLLAAAERAAWLASDRRCRPPGALVPEVSLLPEHVAPLLESCRDVEQRAARTLDWVKSHPGPFNLGTNQLTLGSAAFYRVLLSHAIATNDAGDFQTAREWIGQALDDLRRAGNLPYVPVGLLARAWLRRWEGDTEGARADLREAWQIAARGSMKLSMADILLDGARLFGDKEALAGARTLIEECGYHRRDEELADAEAASAHW
jgi:tetratricopeptide (TPR) repeat protein